MPQSILDAPIYTAPPGGQLPYTVAGAPTARFVPETTMLQNAPAPDTRGEIIKGISRGVDNLQALGYGAAGLVSDALGNKTFAEQMYQGVQRNMAEAAQSPAAVPSFTDIGDKNGYAKDAWDWFWGAAAESLPSSVAALASSGVGAAIFRAAATKLTTDALAKRAVTGAISDLVAKGATEQAAKQAVVKQFFATELKDAVGKAAIRGAYTGGMAASTAMEAGSNWNDDVEKYGIQNTAPWNDLGYGILGGAVEVGLGPEAHLAASLAKEATRKELVAAAKRGVTKNLAMGIGKASLGEGSEEFGQQMLNQMSLARDPLTQQNWKDNFNAAMGGMAGGALFGVGTGATNAMRGSAYKASGGLTEPASAPEMQQADRTTGSRAAQNMLAAGVKTGVVQAQAQQTIAAFEDSIDSMNKRKSELMQNIIGLHNSSMDEASKQQAIIQHENEAFAITAQIANIQNQKTDFTAGVEKEMAKLDRKMVDASSESLVEKANVLLNKDMTPAQTSKFDAMKGVSEQHATNEIIKATTRIVQHQAALKALEHSIAKERAQGWGIPTFEDNSTLKFHEKAIADETKYINTVKKNYTRALEENKTYAQGKNPFGATLPGIDLQGMYRGDDHATNQILAHYGQRTDAAMFKTDSTKDLGPKLTARKDEARTVSKLEQAFQAQLTAQHRANSEQAYQAEQNRIQAELIQSGIEAGPVGGNPAYVDMQQAQPTVATPTMNSIPFENAMVAPRIVDPNQHSQYMADVYGPSNVRNANPAEYQTRVELQRQADRRAAVVNERAAQQMDDTETQNLWNRINADKMAPIAAEANKKVVGWIKGVLRALPIMQDIVKVVHSSELHTLPKYVQDAYKNNPALIDLKTQTIYLFSDNLHSSAEATRAVIHEGVAHFGLRALLTPEQLTAFFRMVTRDAQGNSRWEAIKVKYADYDQYRLAEEYVASIVEQMHLSKVDMPSARRAWAKIQMFFRNILIKMGLVNVTTKDIENIALASVYHLVNMDKEGVKRAVSQHSDAKYNTVLSSRSNVDVLPAGEFQDVRNTDGYEKKFGFMRKLKDALKRTSYSVLDGKIVPGTELSYAERMMTGLHNAFDRPGQLVHTLHNELRKTGGKVTMDENVAEIEKTSHNRIATTVGKFLVNIVGIDPSNKWMHTPGDGTLFNIAAKLQGSNPNIPTDPKEFLHVLGEVLQAMHAEEANLELVRKQYSTAVMQDIMKRSDAIEKKLDSGKLSTAEIAKLEKQLSNLNDQAETVAADIRYDLSGMSNEKAKAIQDKYVTPNNAHIWEEISQRVQGINKEFLDLAVANHLLSPEMRAYWDKLYKNYVPLDVWEAHMATVDPGFASMGRSFDMSMFELSKERKGQAGSETNPIVLLTRKFTQLIQAIEQARVGTALHEMYENHTSFLSEIMERDDSSDARKYAAQIKDILDQADKVLGTSNITSSKETISELNKKIRSLIQERNKAKLQSRAAKTDATKAKYSDKAVALDKDIQTARDAIATLKQSIAEMKATPAYAAAKAQIVELRKQRFTNLQSRGFKVVFGPDGMTHKVRKTNKFEGKSADVVTVFDKQGNKVRYLIKDKYLLASLKGTSTLNPGPVVQMLGRLQRVLAQLMTTYAPPFIAVNWVRDTSTALIHMRNVAEDIKDLHWSGNQADNAFLSNVFGRGGQSALRSALEYERTGKITDPRMAKMMDLYTKYGGYTSMYGMATYDVTKANMERALELTTKKFAPRDAMFRLANSMQDISSAVENSTRLAAFTAIYEALVQNGVTEDKAAQRAAGAALDLTVNFTKKGTWSPILSSLFLFSQASINSTVRIAKAMFPASDHGKPIYKKRITKYASGLAAVGFMMALAAKSMGGTDDDGIDFYDKLPDYVRSTNIVIATGRNQFLRIPVTFGYQSFVAMGNASADILTGRATLGKVTSSIFGSIMENFSFIGGGSEGVAMLTPTLFKPLVQVYANQNYFGGKVYPESGTWKKGEQPDSQKYWSSTTELAKKATLWLNALGGGSPDRKATFWPALFDLSPASLEHVFKQYSGGVGQFMLGVIGAGEKLYTGHTEKLTIDQLPVASRFLSHVDNSATMSEYSRVKTELESQVNEYKRAKAEKVPFGELAAVMQETKAGRLLETRMNNIQHKMSDMKSELNKLELAKGASAEEVYKKRIANEEKAAVLAKQLIRAAGVAGVK